MSNVLQSPKLHVSLAVWQKMMAYIINCPTEVNGFGLVSRPNRQQFVLQDVFITEQVVSTVHAEVDPTVLGMMLTDMLQRGEDPGLIKFQWHSHVSMPAYFSGTDLDNIERWSGDWLISLVANKQGEYSCRLDILSGVRLGVELKPDLVTMIDPDLMTETAQEIAAKVKRQGLLLQRSVSKGYPQSGQTLLGDPPDGITIVGGPS